MATTNLIVDFLVIGTSSFVWITPLVFFVLGSESLGVLLSVNVSAAFGLIGLVYAVGISVSRLADDIMKPWNDRIHDDVFGTNATLTYHNRLNLIIAKSRSASDYLSYRRSLIRISRACALNFLVGALAWIALAWFEPSDLPGSSEILIAGSSAGMFFLMIRTWSVVLSGYFHTIKDMYSYLTQGRDSSPWD